MEVLQQLAKNKPIEVRCAAQDGLAILCNNAAKIAELEQEYGLDFSYCKQEDTAKEEEEND